MIFLPHRFAPDATEDLGSGGFPQIWIYPEATGYNKDYNDYNDFLWVSLSITLGIRKSVKKICFCFFFLNMKKRQTFSQVK